MDCAARIGRCNPRSLVPLGPLVPALRKAEKQVEFFRGVNIDWLGKKWYFLAFSLIFSVAGIISMGWHWAHIGSPVPLGVDFRGGTEVQVQFSQTPNQNRIRQAIAAAGI